jgi:hypothetical protein
MPGSESLEPKISALSLDNNEIKTKTQFDLQTPKFYEPEYLTNEELYDVEASEHSTQLENLQQLLEIANQNEEDAKKDLADMTTRLEASKRALLEMNLQLDMSKAQAKLTIDNLQTNVRSLLGQQEILRKERDQAVFHKKEEQSKNVRLQLSLNDLKLSFDQLSASHEKQLEYIESLKKVILKQNGEIERSKILLENKKPFPPTVQLAGPTLFRQTSALPLQPEMNVFSPTRDW